MVNEVKAILSKDGTIIPERGIVAIEYISDISCRVIIGATSEGNDYDFSFKQCSVGCSAAQLADALGWKLVIIGKP